MSRGYEILDPWRVVRAPLRGRRIEWRVSLRTKARFQDLLGELVDLESEPWSPEREARAEALREDIRALPGYPRNYHAEDDVIVPVTSSVQR